VNNTLILIQALNTRHFIESVDNFLASGIVTKAAIFDRVGKPLAHSPGYNVRQIDRLKLNFGLVELSF
jgi:hypothetical protein